MDALHQIEGWPAPRAAVAAVRADGELGRAGDGGVFECASVTKLFTAYAVLIAAEEGIVELDEPAGPPGATVRHLLAHASGLPLDGDAPLASRPGQRRVYSNRGFEVLGELVSTRAEMPFADYLAEAVLRPLGLAAELPASPAWSLRATIGDLVAFAAELLAPRLVAPETLTEATMVALPGLDGVLPGFGRIEPNDWGLGFELRDAKHPHWTGERNSPRTFGHFGRSGSFLWVDPDARLALACLSDLDFGDWAKTAWPALSDAVLAEAAGAH